MVGFREEGWTGFAHGHGWVQVYDRVDPASVADGDGSAAASRGDGNREARLVWERERAG